MVYGLLRFARNDSPQHRHCEGRRPVAISGWGTMVINQNSSLQGFEKAMAISAWNTIIYLWNSLIFVYLQIIISFSFLFLCLLLVVYGLLRRFTPRNDKEGGNDGYGLFCFAHNNERYNDGYGLLRSARNDSPQHRHCEGRRPVAI